MVYGRLVRLCHWAGCLSCEKYGTRHNEIIGHSLISFHGSIKSEKICNHHRSDVTRLEQCSITVILDRGDNTI